MTRLRALAATGLSRPPGAAFEYSKLNDTLHRYLVAELAERVLRAIRRHSADLLLLLDPRIGDLDDRAVARAACTAAGQASVPVSACSERGAGDAWVIDLGAQTGTARAIQKSAAAAHESQSQALPGLIRRLDALDGREPVRWLASPAPDPSHASRLPHAAPAARSLPGRHARGAPSMTGQPGGRVSPPRRRYFLSSTNGTRVPSRRYFPRRGLGRCGLPRRRISMRSPRLLRAPVNPVSCAKGTDARGEQASRGDEIEQCDRGT